MNISYRWLRDLVPGLSLSPHQVADRLAMLGAPVDEVAELGGPLRDIIIGRVEQAGRHPNADRLSLCTVDAGAGHTVQVVCGAPNVTEGAYYPFAPVGAALPDGMVIRKAKIRGEESQGMLCSARELGLGRDHDGILELHGELTPGASFVEAVGLDDARLVVDVTPNRPDLLSHLGVAREIAAAESLTAGLHALPGAADVAVTFDTGDTRARGDGVTVTIEAPDLCPRYLGLVVRGVKIGPSPAWLASRLRAIGLRPISNVVDATNFVLHELGQPLHAFDLDRIGGTVVVRRAAAGERITTLDGVERTLADGTLVIADAANPIAVAGVMGGADSEVHDDTRDILLECALFDPRSVRATRRALGLSTDASYRFERGIDADGMQRALERAAQLVIATAGGTVAGIGASAGSAPQAPAHVALRLARVEQVLGERFDAAQIEAYLSPLGFDVAGDGSGDDPDSVQVGVPGHRRHDVAREEDLIEEIARRHGYDTFPDELRPFRPSAVPDHALFAVEARLRRLMIARGFMEAHTAAFAPESDGDVKLMLPLAATESRLRGALLPGLLRRVEYNFARAARSIRLFELGTVFAAGEAGDLPREATHLGVAFSGLRRPPHWTEADAAFDVWDLKALADGLGAALGLRVETRTAEAPFDRLLDPALSFALLDSENGEVRGWAGRVSGNAVDAPAWADDCWAIELRLSPVTPAPIRYRALPTQPASERDLALLVPDAVSAESVAALVRSSAGALLEHVGAFDVYSGAGVPDRVRSIAYRLRFRAEDRTLTDAEVDGVVKRVLQTLNDEMGVIQRG
jgi:phenylalanyl-tRNA synthetase beta chain